MGTTNRVKERVRATRNAKRTVRAMSEAKETACSALSRRLVSNESLPAPLAHSARSVVGLQLRFETSKAAHEDSEKGMTGTD